MLTLGESIIYVYPLSSVENEAYILTNLNNVYVLKKINNDKYEILSTQPHEKDNVFEMHRLTNLIRGHKA